MPFSTTNVRNPLATTVSLWATLPPGWYGVTSTLVIRRTVVSVTVATYFGASVVAAFSRREALPGVVRWLVSTGYNVAVDVLWSVYVVVGVDAELQGRVTKTVSAYWYTVTVEVKETVTMTVVGSQREAGGSLRRVNTPRAS